MLLLGPSVEVNKRSDPEPDAATEVTPLSYKSDYVQNTNNHLQTHVIRLYPHTIPLAQWNLFVVFDCVVDRVVDQDIRLFLVGNTGFAGLEPAVLLPVGGTICQSLNTLHLLLSFVTC